MLDKSLDVAREYADAVLLGPLKQLGGILTDTIGGWRLRNQVRVLLGARKLLEENKIDPKGKTYVYNGKTIGFCCPDCIDEFKKNPEKYMATLK